MFFLTNTSYGNLIHDINYDIHTSYVNLTKLTLRVCKITHHIYFNIHDYFFYFYVC